MKKSFKTTAAFFAAAVFFAMLFTVSCKKVPIITPGPVHKDSLFVLTVAYCSKTTTSCDGSATANVHNGTAPYQYLWSNGNTTQTITGLCPGTYSVTITDAAGKSTKGSASIVVCLSLKDTIPHILVTSTCSVNSSSGGCTGTATAIVTGGKLPYAFSWSNGQTTPIASALCPGSYTITVKDAVGKQATNAVTVHACPVDSLHILISASCSSDSSKWNPTGCNGAATALVGGGTYPYSYSWSNGQTTKSITGLCPATSYTVTVTDANGSVATKVTTIKKCH